MHTNLLDGKFFIFKNNNCVHVFFEIVKTEL
jgi:hypothetical protein